MATALGFGTVTVWQVVAAATAGSVAGSAAQWAIGRFLAQFKDHKRFPLKQADYDRYSRWFQRWGVWALAMSWLPAVGDVLTLVGGLFRTPFLLSMVLVALAKGARFALFAYAFATGLPWLLRLFDVG
jgi:membrane protein YqaA with SNARE-associated domain